MWNSDLGLADLVRATIALDPSGQALDQVLEMLGLAWPKEVPTSATRDQEAPGKRDDKGEDESRTSRVGGASTRFDFTPDNLAGLKRLKARKSGRPLHTPTDPLPRREDRHLHPELPYRALLSERTERELVTVAASSPLATAKIDVESAVLVMALGRVLRQIPLLLAPSISHGTQVLVDIGESMQPFRRDQEMLLRRFRDLAGRSTQVHYYADSPLEGAGRTRRRRSWGHYSMPDPGRPVIALTDLGCGTPRRPHAIATWIRLARALQGQDSRLVVFAPIRAEQFEPRLRDSASLVGWDTRTTRAGTIQLRQELE